MILFLLWLLRYPVETVECSDDGIETTKVIRWRLHDKKGGDMSELPADLAVRDFPAARESGGKTERGDR